MKENLEKRMEQGDEKSKKRRSHTFFDVAMPALFKKIGTYLTIVPFSAVVHDFLRKIMQITAWRHCIVNSYYITQCCVCQ